MGHRRTRRHRTKIGKRAFELLGTRPRVWFAAIVVNVVAAVATRSYRFPVAFAIVGASAIVVSFGVWLLGYFAFRHGRIVRRERRISPRRMAALLLAVFMASILAGLITRVLPPLIEEFATHIEGPKAPPPETESD